jgi:hypothetical protein
VVDDVVGVSGTPQRQVQSFDDEAGALTGPGGPAHDATVTQTPDGGQVQLAVTGGELGDVGDPDLVRAFGSELAVQQVGCAASVGSATAPLLAGMGSDQALLLPEASNARVRHLDSGTLELAPHPRRAIGATRSGMDLGGDLVDQRGVGDVTQRRRLVDPLVERRPRRGDEFTHPLHVERVPVLLDETEADHRIVSRAKYAAARRRISVSARNAITSLRHRASSTRSDSDNASGSPARTRAERSSSTQFPNVDTEIPNDLATSARERPDVRTNSTASRRNCCGYFAGRPIPGPPAYGLPPIIRCPRNRGKFRVTTDLRLMNRPPCEQAGRSVSVAFVAGVGGGISFSQPGLSVDYSNWSVSASAGLRVGFPQSAGLSTTWVWGC